MMSTMNLKAPSTTEIYRPAVPISHLTPFDRTAMTDHLQALSPWDRNHRFHSNISDLAIANYTRDLDFTAMVFTGAIEKETGNIVGLAEAHFNTVSKPTSAEITLSVLPSYRGLGLSVDMLGHILRTVKLCGIDKVEFFYQPQNRIAARLLRRFSERHILPNYYTVISLKQNDVDRFITEKNILPDIKMAA